MRIAMLPSTFLPSINGAEVFLHNLILQLQALGHDVHVITWWGNWRAVRGKLPYPVHPLLPRTYTERDRIRLNTKGIVGPGAARQILLYHHIFKFDLFQFNMAGPLGVLCADALRRAGIPTVMRCTGGDLLYDMEIRHGARRNPVLGMALTNAIRGCDHVIGNAILLVKAYRDIGVPEDKISKICNGLDLAYYGVVAHGKVRMREQAGIPLEDPLLLTVGRNMKAKGYVYIPQILRRLLVKGYQPWWMVIGKDSEQLLDLAKREGVQARLITRSAIGGGGSNCGEVGWNHLPSEELIQWYQAADLYVHPGILDALGTTVMEAMAAGLPSAVTYGTGAYEYVLKARCGLVARTHDVGDMAGKIAELLGDPARLRQMAENAREGAKEYDWPIIARKYAEVYERVVRAKRDGGST